MARKLTPKELEEELAHAKAWTPKHEQKRHIGNLSVALDRLKDEKGYIPDKQRAYDFLVERGMRLTMEDLTATYRLRGFE